VLAKVARNFVMWILRAVHKRRSQLGGVCPMRTRGEEVLHMRMSALFGAKNFGFFENYSLSARTREGVGGWASADRGWSWPIFGKWL